jgi:hypothetical protein
MSRNIPSHLLNLKKRNVDGLICLYVRSTLYIFAMKETSFVPRLGGVSLLKYVISATFRCRMKGSFNTGESPLIHNTEFHDFWRATICRMLRVDAIISKLVSRFSKENYAERDIPYIFIIRGLNSPFTGLLHNRVVLVCYPKRDLLHPNFIILSEEMFQARAIGELLITGMCTNGGCEVIFGKTLMQPRPAEH